MELVLKGVISGVVVVAASELARRSTLLAALLVSLPLTSMLALVWLHRDGKGAQELIEFSHAVAWVVAPSIVFFIALPLLLRAEWGFWASMAGATATMVAAYGAFVFIVVKLGYDA